MDFRLNLSDAGDTEGDTESVQNILSPSVDEMGSLDRLDSADSDFVWGGIEVCLKAR